MLLKYQNHCNVVISAKLGGIKYLYKYVYKGEDRSSVAIVREDNAGTNVVAANKQSCSSKILQQLTPRNEITEYQSFRCMAPPAAMYKILALRMHNMKLS